MGRPVDAYGKHEQLFRTLVTLMSDEVILRMRKRVAMRLKDEADAASLIEALSNELLMRDAIAELDSLKTLP